jgi:hypothetical protein
MIAANFQDPGNGREIVAAAQPGRAKVLTDGLQRRFEIIGYLAQMDPAVLGAGSIVDRKSRDLRHCLSRNFPGGRPKEPRSNLLTGYRIRTVILNLA